MSRRDRDASLLSLQAFEDSGRRIAVAAQLRYRRQDSLCLSGPANDHSGARPAAGFPPSDFCQAANVDRDVSIVPSPEAGRDAIPASGQWSLPPVAS